MNYEKENYKKIYFYKILRGILQMAHQTGLR